MWTIQALKTWPLPVWFVAYSVVALEWVFWHWKKALKADSNCGENECMRICKCWGIILGWIEKSHYIVSNMIMNERINWIFCRPLVMTSYEKCVWVLKALICALIFEILVELSPSALSKLQVFPLMSTNCKTCSSVAFELVFLFVSLLVLSSSI